jgi:hypothetical protein
VPARVLGCLPDVQHIAGIDLIGPEQPDRVRCPSGGGPRVGAAGELAGEVVVADLGRRPGDLVWILPPVADDDQGPVRLDQPAQPRDECRPKRNGHRTRNVRSGELGQGSDVDKLRSGGPHRHHLVHRQRGKDGRPIAYGRTAPVDLGQSSEVRRIAPQ